MAPQRIATLIGILICIAITALGTAVTLYLGGGTLDPYKIGGSWLIIGLIAGRVAYNLRGDRIKARGSP